MHRLNASKSASGASGNRPWVVLCQSSCQTHGTISTEIHSMTAAARMQAVEQVLRRILPARGSAKKTNVASPRTVQDAVRGAAGPFIPEHAEQFSQNLVQFLKFRGTLSAWDQECLCHQVHMQRCSARRHSGDPSAIYGSRPMDPRTKSTCPA